VKFVHSDLFGGLLVGHNNVHLYVQWQLFSVAVVDVEIQGHQAEELFLAKLTREPTPFGTVHVLVAELAELVLLLGLHFAMFLLWRLFSE
jgi:hypothetical protein